MKIIIILTKNLYCKNKKAEKILDKYGKYYEKYFSKKIKKQEKVK